MEKYLPLLSFKTKAERAAYVKEQMLLGGLKLLEEYKGNNTPVEVEILEGMYTGYKATATWNNFIKGKRPDFRGLPHTEKERYLKSIFEPEGYKIINLPEYVRRSDKIDLLSPNGHEWSVTVDTFLKGVRCPLDSDRSWGERCVSTILKENGVPFKPQKAIFHKDGSRQFLDFYVEYGDLLIDIEYNGRQHYQEERINKLFNSLESQQKSDKKKADYCKANGIVQVIIPYTIREVKDIATEINKYIPVEVKDYTVESYRYDEKAIVEFYKTHTLKETAEKFNLSGSTIKNLARKNKVRKNGGSLK